MLFGERGTRIVIGAVLVAVLVGLLFLMIPGGLLLAPMGVAMEDEGGAEGVSGILSAVPSQYDVEKAAFAVRARGIDVPYRVMGIFAMPGETIDLQATVGDGRSAEARAGTGQVLEQGANRWQWTAPTQTGWYPLTITGPDGESVRLNAFVMIPFDHTQEAIDGFRVGTYPEKPLDGNPAYVRPRGFIQVTEDNHAVLVSPHFTLGQFTSKQSTTFPKYLYLQERLLVKLEMLLEALNARGIRANTLHVMSAYRTPYYNASIGNETTFSAHVFGAAADVFVDMDDDVNMDDLDGDGEITTDDARFMAGIVEEMRKDPAHEPYRGGLGIYSANPSHGPFIHVDVRGQDVNW